MSSPAVEMLAADFDLVFILAGLGEIKGHLHVHPFLFGATKRLGEPNRHLRADAGLAVDDIAESLPAYAENLGPRCHRKAIGLQALVSDNLAGMHRGLCGHRGCSLDARSLSVAIKQ